MFRVVALYRCQVDDAFRARYAEHAELCRRVPGLTAFRYGPVIGSPEGTAEWTWQGEFEFANRERFRAAMRSDEMRATAVDAGRFAAEVRVHFVELDA